MTTTRLDTFTRNYLECALWASHNDDGEALEGLYEVDDFAPEALASIVEDCEAFQRDNDDDLYRCDMARAGHDFWLTRNRHGAGFWDGDYPDDVGRRLTEAAHVCGSSDLYVGDDGRLYV